MDRWLHTASCVILLDDLLDLSKPLVLCIDAFRQATVETMQVPSISVEGGVVFVAGYEFHGNYRRLDVLLQRNIGSSKVQVRICLFGKQFALLQ
jgi:hypothetical protein